MTNHHCLRVVNWNGRSVHSKQLEFFDFVQQRNIDVAVVTETWLRPNISFLHPDFACVRLDRPPSDEVGRGGGVLIAVRKGLSFKQINISTKTIETTGIVISTGVNQICIVAAYFPGGRRCSDWTQFRRDIRTMTNHDVPFFITGDLNARHRYWNCAKSNKAGNILFQEAAQTGLNIHFPDSPTFVPSGRGNPSTLDIVLSNNLVNMSKPITLNELSSDHLPVCFEISLSAIPETITPTVRCYARANWPAFQRVVNARLDPIDPLFANIQDEDGVNAAVRCFKEVLLDAESIAVPAIAPRPYEVARLPDETKLLIQLRNRRRRQWMRTRDPMLKNIVLALNDRIRTDCANARFSKFADTLVSMERGDNKIWRITKALKNTNKYSPPLRSGDTLVACPKDKAQLLAESFSLAHNNQCVDDRNTAEAVERSVEQIDQSPSTADNSWLVRPKEIANIIRNLKNKKAPGHDGVKNWLLKHLPRKGYVVLSKIFSACFKLSYFPNDWKHAIVVAIPKANKDTSVPTNYRPISLLPTLSKVFERVILTRIEKHLEVTRIIPNEQFGFQKGHSTSHQIVRLVKEVRRNFHQGKSSGLILLDVEKAYDSVWHGAILHKMLLGNFSMLILKMIRSFLKDRTFQVSVNGSTSDRKPVPFGVPQGSVLSPTLYNIFSADIVKINGVEYYFFADDTGFLVSHHDPAVVVDTLQEAQNSIQEYQRKWKVKVNPAKSQAIFFTRRRSPRHLPQSQVSCGGVDIPWSQNVGYLGMTLDPKLKFGCHVANCLQKCDKLTKMLYPLVKRRSRLDRNLKVLLYKTVFRPTVAYGFPVWYDCAQSHRNKIQVKQNRLLKMMLDLSPFHPTEEVHRLAGVEKIDNWFRRLIPKFLQSCASSVNPLLQELAV
ncbi:hypothetical protein RP20_CCG018649 [Aedes albopictus]|nr:hypothetical protein RP20_CCG018649 [Aedes albopictus]